MTDVSKESTTHPGSDEHPLRPADSADAESPSPTDPQVSAPAASSRTVSRNIAVAVILGIAAVVLLLDQLAKLWVVQHLEYGVPQPVLGQVLQFLYVRNSGAAFSFASGSTWVFTVLACTVAVAICWYATKIRSLIWACFLGLLLGGVLGNLTDRLLQEPGFAIGKVIDFIYTPWLLPAIYNVADIAIVSSMVLFLWVSIRSIRSDGTRGN